MWQGRRWTILADGKPRRLERWTRLQIDCICMLIVVVSYGRRMASCLGSLKYMLEGLAEVFSSVPHVDAGDDVDDFDDADDGPQQPLYWRPRGRVFPLAQIEHRTNTQ